MSPLQQHCPGLCARSSDRRVLASVVGRETWRSRRREGSSGTSFSMSLGAWRALGKRVLLTWEALRINPRDAVGQRRAVKTVHRKYEGSRTGEMLHLVLAGAGESVMTASSYRP
jgi:hypothetical protein